MKWLRTSIGLSIIALSVTTGGCAAEPRSPIDTRDTTSAEDTQDATLIEADGAASDGDPADAAPDLEADLEADLDPADSVTGDTAADTITDLDTTAEFTPDTPDTDTTETTDTISVPDAVPDTGTTSDSDTDTDTDTPLDTDTTADTTPLDPPIGIVTWTIRTGDDGSLDDAPGVAYCLGATACMAPENALNWNDRDPRSIDVWHAPGGTLTRADIDRVELHFPPADLWDVACVQVAIDGETIHCAFADALLGFGADAEATWSTSPSIECDTCWDDVLTHGPVIGATSDHDAHIWLRTDASRPVALRIGATLAALRTAAPTSIAMPLAADDFTYTFDVPDLSPSTTYYFDLDVDGRRFPPATDPPYQLRTAPTAGTPARFSIGIGSCARADIDKVPTQPAFAALQALAPDFFLFAGDNVYFDPLSNGAGTNLAGARAFLRESVQRTFSWASPAHSARADFGRDARADFLAHTPTWAVWDDHDFLHDNSYGVAFGVPDPARIWARQAFMEYWPNGTFGDGSDGIYSRFAWGDVDVFMVDGRYFKDVDRISLLGDAQRAWLYDGLRTSSAPFKLIVDGSDWSAESISDSWAGWPTERRGLFEHIVSAHVEGVVFVSGDSHRSELRVLPGADGGYPMPALVSSGIATSIRPCPVTNEFFEVSGSASCYGADTGATTSFITVDVDTTRADPQMTAVIRDVNGLAQRTFTFQASDLTFAPRVALPRRAADFDGDGYADLAIGVPFEDTTASDDGLVHVLYGTNAGLHTADDQSLTQSALTGSNEADDQFGAALAHGDLDGDGFDDLVIGVPGEDYGTHPGTGRAVVLRGSPAGLVLGGESLDLEAEATPGIDQRYGDALAVGDFDGDGRDDVAIGIPGDGPGAVRIFGGSDGPLVRGARLSALDPNLPSPTDPNDPTPSDDPERLGAALAIGDFDGDGYADLAIGAPARDAPGAAAEVGAVLIAYGSPLGLSFARHTLLEPAFVGFVLTPNLHFGAALVAGDLDGDGLDDLAVGVPGAATGAGHAAFFRGVRMSGLATAGVSWSFASLVAGNAGIAGDALGSALAIGDFDHDGKDDLAIGAPGRSSARGIVVVRLASGTVRTLSQDVTNWTVAAPGDRFGAALAAHDFDGDGHADLAVGTPGDIVSDLPAAGVVDLIPGRPNGFDAPLRIYGTRMTQRWHQGLSGLAGGGGAEQGDQLGSALGR